MKRWSSIIFIFLVLNGKGQQSNLIIASSGSGIGNLKLGMTEQEVRDVMAGEFSESDFLQKMKEFKDFNNNLRIDSLVEFVLGFDKILTAPDEVLKKTPVFNLCFKNNRLNYIGIISYSPADSVAREVLLDGKVKFFISKKEGEKLLGRDYLSVRYMDYTDHVYYKKGLEVLYDKGKLACMVIFEPTPGYPALIRKKKGKLLKQFEAIQ